MTIDKDKLRELLGSAPAPAPAPKPSPFETILGILQNPAIQTILQRLIDRWLPPRSSPSPAGGSSPPPSPPITGEGLLNGMIMFLGVFPPETTVGEIVADLQAKRQEYAAKLDAVLKNVLGR
jgi:hypothetical protein